MAKYLKVQHYDVSNPSRWVVVTYQDDPDHTSAYAGAAYKAWMLP